MSNNPSLWLHEELVLLAIQPEKGTIPVGVQLGYPAAGAGLAELLLGNRIRLEKVKRSFRVVLVQTSMLGEPILDEWLEKIRTSRKTRSPEEWLARMQSVRRVPQRLTERLWFKSILRREERTALLFFKHWVHPLGNVQVRTDIVGRMRACLDSRCQPPARDALLLGLARQANLLRYVLSSSELKLHRRRLKELVKAHPILAAVSSAAASRSGHMWLLGFPPAGLLLQAL